jgi:hypothetical protein
MPLVRRPDWRSRLDQYLAACARRKFDAGRHDCALFAAGAVEAVTGTDLAAEYRGRYRTIRGGKRIAGGDHVALAASLLPSRESVLHARPGDIAVLGDALGVVCGEHIAALHPVRGLASLPLTRSDLVLAV